MPLAIVLSGSLVSSLQKKSRSFSKNHGTNKNVRAFLSGRTRLAASDPDWVQEARLLLPTAERQTVASLVRVIWAQVGVIKTGATCDCWQLKTPVSCSKATT